MNSEKPLWKRRISVVEVIYSYLIFDLVSKNNNQNFNKEGWTDFESNIFKNFLDNQKLYFDRLSSLLRKDWELDRLNIVVLCILYEAISEYYAINTPIAVLIEQSVKTAKNYCEAEEYKLVHAILENCLNKRWDNEKTDN